MAPAHVRPASRADLPALAALVDAFHRELQLPSQPDARHAALARLIDDPVAGRIWVAAPATRDTPLPAPHSPAPASGDSNAPAAYAAVAWVHSIEFGGRVGLLDELYVAPAFRGLGLGKRLVQTVLTDLGNSGIPRLRLEIDRHHPGALTLYRQLGFEEDGRTLWSRPTSPPA